MFGVRPQNDEKGKKCLRMTRGIASQQLRIKVPPSRIEPLDQLVLPAPAPSLQHLLSADGLIRGIKHFIVDQLVYVIPGGKTGRYLGAVFMDPANQIVGDADV